MTRIALDKAVRDGDCDVTIEGEIDLCCADDVATLATLSLDDPHLRSLTLDLAAVTFMDSTGIGALVRIRNTALEVGKQLTLRDPSEPVTKVLKITGLDTVFAVQRTGEGIDTTR
ncbi:MAG: anti-sigma factor antagonist [Pseudonocardiales bacterium]|nr:MAG: anti-sigma factor antagonist [Pseudonocardiales bacterium]